MTDIGNQSSTDVTQRTLSIPERDVAPLCLQLKTARARTLLTTPDALYWLVPRRPFKRSTIAWKGKFVIPLHLLCATSSACLMACEFA